MSAFAVSPPSVTCLRLSIFLVAASYQQAHMQAAAHNALMRLRTPDMRNRPRCDATTSMSTYSQHYDGKIVDHHGYTVLHVLANNGVLHAMQESCLGYNHRCG
jgi:hypothetical protein